MSWGVLSSLVRALDRRDGRTARHSAAVAAFARDIALECGMSKRDAELAHTAGLLHDIGRFALPDRVMERHGTLTEDDWEAIHQHPELGADLLQRPRRLRPGRADRARAPRAHRRARLPATA